MIKNHKSIIKVKHLNTKMLSPIYQTKLNTNNTPIALIVTGVFLLVFILFLLFSQNSKNQNCVSNIQKDTYIEKQKDYNIDNNDTPKRYSQLNGMTINEWMLKYNTNNVMLNDRLNRRNINKKSKVKLKD